MNVVIHQKRFNELTIDELYELLRIRSEVFVVEQDCVYQDLDGDDQSAIHLWLTVDDDSLTSQSVQSSSSQLSSSAQSSFSAQTPISTCASKERIDVNTAKKVVALCRVCPAGTHMKEVSIGRVITTERGRGYGKRIMLQAIETARQQFSAKQIDIEAQVYAQGFYEQVGFRQSSEPFILDGIPHIKMTWREPGGNSNCKG